MALFLFLTRKTRLHRSLEDIPLKRRLVSASYIHVTSFARARGFPRGGMCYLVSPTESQLTLSLAPYDRLHFGQKPTLICPPPPPPLQMPTISCLCHKPTDGEMNGECHSCLNSYEICSESHLKKCFNLIYCQKNWKVEA